MNRFRGFLVPRPDWIKALYLFGTLGLHRLINENSEISKKFKILKLIFTKGLGAIRAKIGPISDVDKIFSKMSLQYVLFRNKYS